MGHPDGAHTHGSSLSWGGVAVIVLIAAIGVGGGLSEAVSGLETALFWVAGVVLAALVVAAAVIWRVVTRSGRNYVRSIHGMTERDRILDENARLRAEIAATRATRLEIERQRMMYYGPLQPGWMHEEPITARAIRSEPIPGHEA